MSDVNKTKPSDDGRAQPTARRRSAEKVSRPRGRPRNADVDQAIDAATVALLAERGYADLTLEAVATRAGVSRPTLYRRWPSKETLVVDLLIRSVPPLTPSSTDNALHDLCELAAAFATRLAGSPLGAIVLAVHAEAARRPALAEPLREHYLRPRDALITEVIDRGVASGQLNPDLGHDTIRDLVFGPLIYHWLVTGQLDTTTARTLVTAASRAVAAPGGGAAQ